MKVLLVSPEVTPLARTGGLGDVVGALPPALKAKGVDARILCPLHKGSLNGREGKALNGSLTIRMGSRKRKVRIIETRLPGSAIPVYLISHKGLYDRKGLYAGLKGDYSDNAERSMVLCRTALHQQKLTGWQPDVYHSHDWMAAALPACLNAESTWSSSPNPASVLTIHNLEHQGIFSGDAFNLTGLPQSYFSFEGFEHYGNLNLLKGGIQHADKITTVSPTYSREIQEEANGQGLHETLSYRAADLIGILNGIDEKTWNPQKDHALPSTFGIHNVKLGKQVCRQNLCKELDISCNPKLPLLGVVSRLCRQKGLDLLLEVVPKMLEKKECQLALLGSGDKDLEKKFIELGNLHPKSAGIKIGFDDKLARRIFGGSDFFVMPSRFEPCGLAQQYAMRYGALPIARKTGGLSDTIEDVNDNSVSPTGFLFDEMNADSLRIAIARALKLFQQREAFNEMQVAAMGKPARWDTPAGQYIKVYQWALEKAKLGQGK